MWGTYLPIRCDVVIKAARHDGKVQTSHHKVRLPRNIKGCLFLSLNFTLHLQPTMKTIILTSALLFSTALATVVPKAPKKVDYSGFKVLRVASTDDVKAQIESLAAHVLNPGKSAELDVVVSPENIAALTALVAASEVLNDDVGAALAEEGQMSAYAGSWDASHSWSYILNKGSSQRDMVRKPRCTNCM
jgi:hypothetical protein